ncbi:YlzJ-like family protein [Peribacillus simplex]|nr:YlzJ-like family protein [Peribacillus simplex]
MEVEPMGEEQARIVRLLDCGLEHYLNSSYAPGSIIRYIPTIAAGENEAKG